MFPTEEVRKSLLPPAQVRLPTLRRGIVIFKSKNRLILRGGSELILKNTAHGLKSSPPNDSRSLYLHVTQQNPIPGDIEQILRQSLICRVKQES